MATSTFTSGRSVGAVRTEKGLIGGLGFDRVMVVLTTWFMGGLYLDGWAHGHGKVDKTFFTPWHGILYSGYFFCAILLVVAIFLNRRRVGSWFAAIPAGYELALVGAPLFLVAGVGDLIWHTLFGFEVGIEPLLSPTHLLLACSGILIMGGPLRAAWLRAEGQQGWRTLLPAVLSWLAVFSVLTFFTEFAQPFANIGLVVAAFDNEHKARGAAAIILQATLLMGFVLFMVRRWRLPLGTFTLVFTLNVTLISFLSDQHELIPGVLIAGVLIDILYRVLRPSVERVGALRLFAFCAAPIYYLAYFITLMLTYGITWTIHLWLGSVVITGVIGLLLSYMLVAPVAPGVSKAE